LVALSLARFGIREMALVDPDLLEQHNLDAMGGVRPVDVGRPKVEALAEAIEAIAPATRVVPYAASVAALEALPALTQSDVIVTCVDDDGARWASGVIASLFLKVHLDIGTGIHRSRAGREMGADVRLIVPGEACVLCFGGLTRSAQVRAMRGSAREEIRARDARDWRHERAGSLLSLNHTAVGLGLRLVEDLFAGHVRRSAWIRLEFSSDGEPTLETVRPQPAPGCPVCHLHGMGEAGLAMIPQLPDSIGVTQAPM
jgi:hypothetical protein